MKMSLTCIAALMIASPALAQDLCGGSGAGGQWIGGTEDASDISTADAHREQLALVLGGTPYVGLFSLSAPTPVRIEAAGRGAGDPLIEIFDANGGIVASDDDSGGGGAARSELDLPIGTYCVTMKSYEDAPMSAFMRIGRQDQDALTPGTTGGPTSNATGSCADARPFGDLGTTQSASVEENGFWSFTLDTPTALTIAATNEDADPTIALFDGTETEIASNDDHDGLNARIERSAPLPAGDYCVSVGAINDSSLPIDLTIDAYDPVAALAALYARGEASPPLDGSVDVIDLGSLQARMRKDLQLGPDTSWFTVDIPESSLLLIEAVSAGGDGDPWLVVFDDLGRQIAVNDDAGNSLNSMITTRVQAGQYVVGAKQVGDSVQGFVRLVLERYVPAE
ncbi:MAG: ABC transporter substrate-binding protein [Yoonia sp.]|nr:ABC transporter substrate-binding protein [Yoonia sp.]